MNIMIRLSIACNESLHPFLRLELIPIRLTDWGDSTERNAGMPVSEGSAGCQSAPSHFQFRILLL